MLISILHSSHQYSFDPIAIEQLKAPVTGLVERAISPIIYESDITHLTDSFNGGGNAFLYQYFNTTDNCTLSISRIS